MPEWMVSDHCWENPLPARFTSWQPRANSRNRKTGDSNLPLGDWRGTSIDLGKKEFAVEAIRRWLVSSRGAMRCPMIWVMKETHASFRAAICGHLPFCYYSGRKTLIATTGVDAKKLKRIRQVCKVRGGSSNKTVLRPQDFTTHWRQIKGRQSSSE